MKKAKIRTLTLIWLLIAGNAQATELTLTASDFSLNPLFSDVQTFTFSIKILGPLLPGASVSSPALDSVTYNVSGTLNGTPSGFPAFDLQRTITGEDFYAQGSSLAFSISPLADLSDGLQVSELTAAVGEPVFALNAREVGTGRYHPPLVVLYADGSGSIQNSNNTGGINPATLMEVNVDFGDEYVTELSFLPTVLTLAPEDIDGDSIAQTTDNCALTPNTDQLDLDGTDGGDACDFDDDDDGVDDVFDNCPRISNPAQADADGDGIGNVCDDDTPGC